MDDETRTALEHVGDIPIGVTTRQWVELKSDVARLTAELVQARLELGTTRTMLVGSRVRAKAFEEQLKWARALLREAANTAHLDDAHSDQVAAWFGSYRYSVRTYLRETAALASGEET